jgi:hypothetical protein
MAMEVILWLDVVARRGVRLLHQVQLQALGVVTSILFK